ncbi:unnamed protein product [Lactuca saligna]|uniref:Uncharacterized protein n=1 Tax=Lactuca saligna TaxID=75948 RepID=A0AA36E282_LACSI|nr:unnamed protein product [Lactuca saligna]
MRPNHQLQQQGYWDATYADDLTNFREHGDAGEVWFGADVMEMVSSWTKGLCVDISQRHLQIQHKNDDSESVSQEDKDLAGWSVLDVGTGNGLLLQELAKQGYSIIHNDTYFSFCLANRDEFIGVKLLLLIYIDPTAQSSRDMLGIDTRVQLTGSGERCLRCEKVEHDDETESEPEIVHRVGSEARHVIRTTQPIFFLTVSCRNRLHHLFPYSLIGCQEGAIDMLFGNHKVRYLVFVPTNDSPISGDYCVINTIHDYVYEHTANMLSDTTLDLEKIFSCNRAKSLDNSGIQHMERKLWNKKHDATHAHKSKMKVLHDIKHRLKKFTRWKDAWLFKTRFKHHCGRIKRKIVDFHKAKKGFPHDQVPQSKVSNLMVDFQKSPRIYEPS